MMTLSRMKFSGHVWPGWG